MADIEERELLRREVAQLTAFIEAMRGTASVVSAALAAPVDVQRDVVSGVDQATQQPPVQAALKDGVPAFVEADVAEMVRRSREAFARLEGTDISTWPDLQHDIAVAFFTVCAQLMQLQLKLAAHGLRAFEPVQQVQAVGLGFNQAGSHV